MKKHPTSGRRRAGSRALIAALVAAAIGVAAATTASAAREAAPSNTSTPTIEGTFQVDQTVTVANGDWNNNPTSFTYQWQRCSASVSSCGQISGATSNDYKLTSQDVGNRLRVVVTAKNADGNDSVTSHATPIVSGSSAPTNTSRPTISGTPKVGESLQVSNGNWTGGVRSYTYQWQRCDTSGNNCVAVPGATAQSYGVRTADVGHTLRVDVTAHNGAGKTTVNTDRSNTVAEAQSSSSSNSQPSGSTTKCATGSTVAAADLAPPVRMIVDKWQFSPDTVKKDTHVITARVHIADTCGRSVAGANVWSTAIPYNQTSVEKAQTASDGWATFTFQVQRGFPANPGRQGILAILVRATEPGTKTPLAGSSTRRVLRENVNLAA